ncbi:FAD-binding domain-containing protein, partial [Obba rivulosa]
MSDWLEFQNHFTGDLVTQSDPGYEQAIARWARNASRKARIVAFPKDAQDVVRAIAYSKQAGLPLAIRGGGHNASGASSSEGGLVIDLSRYLNGVRVDPEQRRAYVGGGAIWESVDRAAMQHGLATVGGTVNHTGVGGLTLGGGFGWLTGKYGLVIDNLLQVTIVTAGGKILTANASEHADLFWGIRGGGCNFGVCTEFVLQLHPQRSHVYAGLVIFTPDKVEQIASTVQSWWQNGPSENSAVILFLCHDLQGNPCVMLDLFYNGSESEGREYFKAIFDAGPAADMTKEVPYEQVNGLMNDFAIPGRNYYLKGGFVASDYDLVRRVPEVLDAVSSLIRSGKQPVQAQFELIPLQAINRVEDDATAFQRGVEANVLIISVWDDDSPGKLQFVRDVAAQLLLIASGTSSTNGYGNYNSDAAPAEGTTSEDKIQLFFGSNYSRLRALKKKYDPEVIFDKWFVITPA